MSWKSEKKENYVLKVFELDSYMSDINIILLILTVFV